MRVQGVTIVKNEADIIEAFVRHHLRLLDALWVIDNGSTDATRDILAALRGEGLPLRVTEDRRSPHPQEEAMSEVVSGWQEDCDWLFLLDADEFIDCSSREALRGILSELDAWTCYLAAWDFMVPTAQDDADEPNPVARIRHRRDAPTPHYLAKVVIPRALLGRDDVRVGPGNHVLVGPDLRHAALEQIRLAHFPIRSVQQLARKAVIGAWAISGRVHRQVGENHHWRRLRDQVLEGRGVTQTDLQTAAANYAEQGAWTDWPLLDRPVSPRPEGRLRYVRPEIDWRQYAVEYADAHFRTLDRRILDQPPLLKTARGITAAGEGDQADVLDAHGDLAPDLVELAACLVEEGDVIVHHEPRGGYLTTGLARTGARVVALPDEDEDWLRTNLLLSGTRDVVTVGPAPRYADLLVGAAPVVAARRMILLGETAAPDGYRQVRLRLRIEPQRDLITGEPVSPSRAPWDAVLALRPEDPLCEDLSAYLSGTTVGDDRWEARGVIETLILRRRMRKYKKQQSAQPVTPLERRWTLEEHLRADEILLGLVAGGSDDEVRSHLRAIEPELPDAAVEQLCLQLRVEAARTGVETAPTVAAPAAVRDVDQAVMSEIEADLRAPENPLRALADFEPVSRVYRKSADRTHLFDHPHAATLVLAELRRSGVLSTACARLGGTVVMTFETAVAGPGTSASGLGCALAASGVVTWLEPGDQPAQDTLLTLWFFPADAPPPGHSALLA